MLLLLHYCCCSSQIVPIMFLWLVWYFPSPYHMQVKAWSSIMNSQTLKLNSYPLFPFLKILCFEFFFNSFCVVSFHNVSICLLVYFCRFFKLIYIYIYIYFFLFFFIFFFNPKTPYVFHFIILVTFAKSLKRHVAFLCKC